MLFACSFVCCLLAGGLLCLFVLFVCFMSVCSILSSLPCTIPFCLALFVSGAVFPGKEIGLSAESLSLFLDLFRPLSTSLDLSLESVFESLAVSHDWLQQYTKNNSANAHKSSQDDNRNHDNNHHIQSNDNNNHRHNHNNNDHSTRDHNDDAPVICNADVLHALREMQPSVSEADRIRFDRM